MTTRISEPHGTVRTGLARNVMKSLCVPEWAKNGFVFAPLLFSGHLGDVELVGKVALVAVVLCVLSSSVYILNDIVDREHPRNRSDLYLAGAQGSAHVMSGAGATVASKAPWRM